MKKCFVIPQRYIMVILGWLGIVSAYYMRSCLSIAITKMVKIIDKENVTKTSDDTCHYADEYDNTTTSSINLAQFEWRSQQKGIVLSIFYVGYCTSHVPGGFLSEQIGGKYVFGIGLLISAILTLLTPIVTMKLDYIGLSILRLIMGVTQGAVFPSLNTLLSNWVPLEERARLGSFAFSGTIFGTILGNTISGWAINQTRRWDTPFYIFGVLTIIWYIAWQVLVFNEPETHPYIYEKELEYLKESVGERKKVTCKKTPWLGILTNIPVNALIVAEIGHDWGFYSMCNDLPTYMNDILKFKVSQNGMLSSLPYVAMWILAMSSATLVDSLIKKKKYSVALLRKFFTGIAGLGPGLFLLLAAYSGCNRTLSVICFCCALGTMGCYYPGMRVNALDLSRNYCSIIMGIVNGIGTVSGMVAPYLIDCLTTQHLVSEWKVVFWISFFILAGSVVVYSFWGSGSSQPFNDPDYVWPGCCKKSPNIDNMQ